MKSNFSHEEWIVVTNKQSTSYREHTPYIKSIQRAHIHYHKKESSTGTQIKATNSNLLSDIKYLRATTLCGIEIHMNIIMELFNLRSVYT